MLIKKIDAVSKVKNNSGKNYQSIQIQNVFNAPPKYDAFISSQKVSFTGAQNKPTGIIELTDATFDKEIKKAGTTLVDFWAPWCGPCKAQTPVLEKLAKDFDGAVKIAKVNIENNPIKAGEYNIRSIPNMLLFKDGGLVKQFMGLQTEKTLSTAIKKIL